MMITIYGTDSCVYCDRAKQLCEMAGIQYRTKDISTVDKEWLKFKVGFEPRTVPQIFFDKEYVGGYTELKLFITKKGKEWSKISEGMI
jgi:glutaredoxin 1